MVYSGTHFSTYRDFSVLHVVLKFLQLISRARRKNSWNKYILTNISRKIILKKPDFMIFFIWHLSRLFIIHKWSWICKQLWRNFGSVTQDLVITTAYLMQYKRMDDSGAGSFIQRWSVLTWNREGKCLSPRNYQNSSTSFKRDDYTVCLLDTKKNLL